MSTDRLPILGVDCHAHVLKRDAPLVQERHSVPERDASVDEFVSLLASNGLSHGVLTAPSFYGTDNSLLLSALDSQPRRLCGTVIVEPGVARSELEAMDRRGVVGIRLNWIRRGGLPDLATSPWQQLFRTIDALGWHVELLLEGERMQNVLPAILVSGAKLVLDHFGCPEPQQGVRGPGFEAVLDALRGGRTWVKLSAPYRLRGASPRPYVDAFLEAGVANRLVWASDWPWVSHAPRRRYDLCLAWLNDWIDDPALRRRVLVDTPLELFRFGGRMS